MSESVELSSFDLRYESHRLRNNAWEARLLASMTQRGIENPLEGVDPPQGRFLLNGFKRYRCARKLEMACVPYVSLGSDEAMGILSLMRASTDHGLGLLEQARFLDDLLTVHGMSLTEVAETLCRSKAWVSTRRSLLAELSPVMREALFGGTFPAYCYMYTLRSFKRVNEATPEQIDRFVTAAAGKGLSVREIDLLGDAYFRGPASLREAIEAGKLVWSLEHMKQVPQDPEGCNEFERVLLEDLRRLHQECQGWLQRIHEKLVEEHKIQVSYPTLTRLVRELGLSQPRRQRCDRVPDEPGLEMQHDTTIYQVDLAGKPTRVIASLLYLRYSKRRYLKFYRVFNRFAMKWDRSWKQGQFRS